jgi:hypothetical protein
VGKLKLDSKLVLEVGMDIEDGINKPENAESRAYTIRTPRNSKTDEIPMSKYGEIA